MIKVVASILMSMGDKKILKCPQCLKLFDYHASDFRPFCCERCQMIDLGHWLGESYTIARPPTTPEEVAEVMEEVAKNDSASDDIPD